MKISTVVSKALSLIYMGVLGSAVYLGTPQLLTATMFLSWVFILLTIVACGFIYLAFKLDNSTALIKIVDDWKVKGVFSKVFSGVWQTTIIVGLIYLGLVVTALILMFAYLITWFITLVLDGISKEVKKEGLAETGNIIIKDFNKELTVSKDLANYIAKLNKNFPQ